MIKMVLLLFTLTLSTSICPHISFDTIHTAFNTIPDYQYVTDINGGHHNGQEKQYRSVTRKSGITKEMFYQVLSDCSKIIYQDLSDNQKWTHQKSLFNRALNSRPALKPFVMGINVPAGTNLFLLADRHGDAKSTVNMIKDLIDSDGTLRSPATRIIFLGDYVDRGIAGVETLYYIARLKIANPDQVWMVRGNHEDMSINKRFGFTDELIAKFGSLTEDDIAIIKNFYDSLPVAIFVGTPNAQETTYALCCHGFVDSRYVPFDLYRRLSSVPINHQIYDAYNLHTRRAQMHKKVQEVVKSSLHLPFFTSPGTALYDIDFMWADIIDNPNAKTQAGQAMNNGRPAYDEAYAQALLNDWSLSKKTPLKQSLPQKIGSWFRGWFPGRVNTALKEHSYTVGWVFRGHQHATATVWEQHPDMTYIMNKLLRNWGIARAWNTTLFNDGPLPYNTVYTLLVAPNNPYGVISKQYTGAYPGFNYDTMIQVTTGSTPDNWTIARINKKMFNEKARSLVIDGKKYKTYLS